MSEASRRHAPRSPSAPSTKLTCLCGSKECSGVSAVFKVLRNVRGAHLAVPSMSVLAVWRRALQLADGSQGDQEEDELQRLLRMEANMPPAHETDCHQHVALHHFHPHLLEHHVKQLIPGKLVRLQPVVFRTDDPPRPPSGTILVNHAVRVGDYSVVIPDYSMDLVKQEAQALFRAFKQEQARQAQPPVVAPRAPPLSHSPAQGGAPPHPSPPSSATDDPSPTTLTPPVSSQGVEPPFASSPSFVIPALETCQSDGSQDGQAPRIYHDDSSSDGVREESLEEHEEEATTAAATTTSPDTSTSPPAHDSAVAMGASAAEQAQRRQWIQQQQEAMERHDMALQPQESQSTMERVEAASLPPVSAESRHGKVEGMVAALTEGTNGRDPGLATPIQEQAGSTDLGVLDNRVKEERHAQAPSSDGQKRNMASASHAPTVEQARVIFPSIPWNSSQDASLDSHAEGSDDVLPVPISLDAPDSKEGGVDSLSARIEAGGKVVSLDEFFDDDANELDDVFEGPIDVDALTDAFLSQKRGVYRFRKYKVDDDLNIILDDPTEHELSQLQSLRPLKLLQEGKSADGMENIAVMTAIESKRRYWAMAELETMSIEWSWYRIIIQRMLKQTDQIEDLLESSFNGLAVYALMLKDIYNDGFLDDSGNMISGTANREKIGMVRRQEVKESHLLDTSRCCLREIADRIAEDNEMLDSDVFAMAELRKELLHRTLLLLREGDEILATVEETESKIQDYWDRFEKADAYAAPISIDSMEKITDRWLAEASYKLTVNKGMVVWKESYSRMSSLFATVTELDSQRRTRCKEILLSFIPRRRKIFIRICELIEPSKEELENERLSRNGHLLQIEQTLHQLSRIKLSMKPNRSSILNRSRTFDSQIGSPIDLQPLTEKNLFDSYNVKDVSAIEFQDHDRSVFEIGLAVITNDGFLHIIADESESVEVVNAAIFHGDSNEAQIQLRHKFNGRLPRVSLYIPSCPCSLASDNTSVEFVLKQNATQGMSERVSVRLFSPQATCQWWQSQIDHLKIPQHQSKGGSPRSMLSSIGL